MKMNVPNTLTIIRVLLIPFFVAFMLCNITAYDNYIALAIFIVASLTDTLDGYLARKNNQVTNFGKFMDPLADKLLVCSALICLLSNGMISTVVVLIIIAREFIISGFRLVAVDNGIVIAASWWGKAKTISQMIMIILLIASFGGIFNVLHLYRSGSDRDLPGGLYLEKPCCSQWTEINIILQKNERMKSGSFSYRLEEKW